MKLKACCNNIPSFGMKIRQNRGLDYLKKDLRSRGYSDKKIEGIMDSIKKMADDSYEFKVNSVSTVPYEGYICYSVTNDNPVAPIKNRGEVCSTVRFFLLRSVKNLTDYMVKTNESIKNLNK